MTSVESSNSSYDIVVKVFIEFRNKGVSLSSLDLDTLEKWEKRSLDPQFLCQVMTTLYQENKINGKPFPKSLSNVAYHVDKILLKMKDF